MKSHTNGRPSNVSDKQYAGFTYEAAPESMRLSDEGRMAIGEELYRRMSCNDALRESSMNSAAGILVASVCYR